MPETDFMDAGALAVRVAELTAALAERDSVIADFKVALSNRDADYAALLERVGDLERRLGLDSSNSGKPPSSDGLAKPNAPSRDNARRRSDRRPGGQKGHPGSTLARSGTPDRIEHHRPEVCPGCGGRLDPGDSEVHASRQVHDIPEPVPPQVIEHRVHRCRCRACGEVAVAGFPEGVNAPAQYGLNARALVLYLNSVQFIPRQRQVELLRDLFGLKLSQGTVSAIIGRGAGEFAQLAGQIRKLIAEAPVKHMDETGIRVEGRLRWLHVACALGLGHFRVGASRGDVMAEATGVAVHDHWKSYFKIPGATHSMCLAHYLRELGALVEFDGEGWAGSMGGLLRRAIHAGNLAGEGTPMPPRLADLVGRRYDEIVARGVAHHESLPPPVSRGSRGRRRRRKGHNLVLRMRDHRDDVLRFSRDGSVPPTNNAAERLVRPVKVQQKISGSFRSRSGAEASAVLRTVVETARMRGWNLLDTLQARSEELVERLRPN